MNQTSVYATAIYESTTDTFRLVDLTVYKLSFDRRLTSNDTLYQFGAVSYLRNDSIVPGSPYSGTQPVTISLDPDWVRLQQHDARMILWFLAKPQLNGIDTLHVPTASFMQYPVLPRVVSSGKTYRVYRPGTGDLYAGLYRKFQANSDTLWTDEYGEVHGIVLKTAHALSLIGDTLHFEAIVDSHGIAVGQNVIATHMVQEEVSSPVDTLVQIFVTRRLVDFTSPGDVESLSYYMQAVLANGLKPIHGFPMEDGSVRIN